MENNEEEEEEDYQPFSYEETPAQVASVSPARPTPPPRPWRRLERRGHPDPDISLVGQESCEQLGGVIRRFMHEIGAAHLQGFPDEEIGTVYRIVKDDDYQADKEAMAERTDRIIDTCDEFLMNLGTGDTETAWNTNYRDIRKDLNDREVHPADLIGEEKEGFLRDLGADSPRTEVMISRFLKNLADLGKRYASFYDFDEGDGDIEIDDDDEDEEEEDSGPTYLTQRQITQRLANQQQFNFLFRYLDEYGNTQTTWTRTNMPSPPPENPSMGEWIVEWSRQSGAPPEEIEAEIAARQAPFRDGTQEQLSTPRKKGPGPTPRKPSPFKRPD